jgi:hypothetical protein
MSELPNGARSYEIHGSAIVLDALRQAQRRSAREGRGPQVLTALRLLRRRLQQDPFKLGEPLYRLTALRVQVRTVVISPLVVDFGVCDDRPLVFIKGVTLLSKP